MAIDPAELAPGATEQPPHAPLGGTRSQAMQRLQVGLFGLAAMILLVGLANIIKTNVQENEARVVPEAAPTVVATGAAAPVSDPLADAGVVPERPAEPRPIVSPPPPPSAADATAAPAP